MDCNIDCMHVHIYNTYILLIHLKYKDQRPGASRRRFASPFQPFGDFLGETEQDRKTTNEAHSRVMIDLQ